MGLIERWSRISRKWLSEPMSPGFEKAVYGELRNFCCTLLWAFMLLHILMLLMELKNNDMNCHKHSHCFHT